MVTEGLPFSGEHTMQYTNDILKKCIFETFIMVLTNGTSINLIKLKIKKLGVRKPYAWL